MLKEGGVALGTPLPRWLLAFVLPACSQAGVGLILVLGDAGV